MTLHPPSSTLFPYTTLFRSILLGDDGPAGADAAQRAACAGVAAGDDPDRIGDAPLPEADAGLAEQEQQQRSEEHTSELQSRRDLVCRLLLEKKKKVINNKLD